MKKNHFKVLFSFVIMALVMLSCENNLEMVLPQGPQGEKGDKGDPGKSAFELWIEHFGKDPNTSIEEFFNSLKGKDGKDGAVPVIGENGNWIIDGRDTGIPARGKDGKDGVTPEIGENGNWIIDGRDTGVPARGRNGFTPVIGENGNWFINGEDTGKPSRGADGKTPTVEIGPGPDYYWIIDGVTTNITAKGQDGKDGSDGKDGFTPVIGENGNWWIDGQDTGKPSVIIPEIGPGPNYNWFIDGVDTGKPSRGEDGVDGVDGKSAYELWKEAVELCDGTVTNKDGSPYDCTKSSWEDFLIWLQGGDISVLHQYWTTLPGNQGKTIQQFIDELFDCHCDGITVGMQYEDTCVELNPDGTVKGTYNATLSIGGKAGTSVVVTGNGVNLSGNITNDQTPVTFNITRGDDDIDLTIVCTESGNVVTKGARIPALKYIKLESETTVTQVADEQKDVVVINFAAAPVEVSVGGVVIYNASGIVDGSGWAVSNEGKTFTGTYDRGANVQSPTVQAKGADPICSTIENAFTIPTLTPVEVTGDPVLAAIAGNNCDLQLTLEGTPGMTVTATYGSNPATAVELTENPAGTYTTTAIPRKFTAYDVTVEAKMEGRGTVTKTVRVEGVLLFTNTLQVTDNNGTSASGAWANAIVINEFTNTGTEPITVTFTGRAGNANATHIKRNSPSHGAYPFNITINPGETEEVQFYRDYTNTFASGNYTVNYTVENDCGESTASTSFRIDNQSNYRANFTRPDGWGGEGQPGGPGWDYETDGDPDVTFNVEVLDAIPNSYIEFQLRGEHGYTAVFRGQADASGKLTRTVTMKASELQRALDDGFGNFLFFTDSNYTNRINIGATKERIPFTFD